MTDMLAMHRDIALSENVRVSNFYVAQKLKITAFRL